MENKELYYDLIDSVKDVCDNYGYEHAYELGKSLDYRLRLNYEYKIKCYRIEENFNEAFSASMYEKEFIARLVENDELDYILNNINDIIRNSNCLSNKLLSYLKMSKNLITNSEWNNIETAITRSVSQFYPNVKDDDMLLLRFLLVKVANSENTDLLDIRKVIDNNSASKYFRIKNKLIKVGYKKLREDVIDNRRLLLPYFKNYVGKDFVEITDYVEPAKNLGFDDFYTVYEELRDQGIIWLNPKDSSLTRASKELIENNKKKSRNNIGLLENQNYLDKNLEEGDLMITNLDSMVYDYDEERAKEIEFDINGVILKRRQLLEERYNNSKVKKLIKN